MPLIFTHTSWVPAALCTLLLYFYEGQQSRSSLAQRHEKERERQGKRGGREGGREWARSQLWRTFSYIQGNNTIWPAGLQHEGVMVICHSVVYAYTSRLTACSSKSPPRLYFPDTTALLCNVKSPRSHVGIRSDSQVNVRWFKANTNTDQICKITWQNQWKLMKETKGKKLLICVFCLLMLLQGQRKWGITFHYLTEKSSVERKSTLYQRQTELKERRK